MSFVLDALKLSEKRRSRFARPVYTHPPRAHRGGRRGRWYALLAAVPIIAGVFLTWRLAAPTAPAQLSATPDAAVMSATAANPAPAAIDDREMSRDLGREAPGDPYASTDKKQPEPPVPIAAAGDPAASTGKEQAAPQVPVAAAEPAPARLPPQPEEGLALEMPPPDWPALTLQMLFYSQESGRSFVQINGRNYRVGERLEDGPEVLEIAPHGAILAYQGKKVLLAMDR